MKSTLVVAVTTICLLVASSVSADALSDKAMGAIQTISIGNIVNFSAQSGPNGEQPFGHVHHRCRNCLIPFPAEDFFEDALVTCLRVVGHRAAIGSVVVRTNIPSRVGQGRIDFVEDNGSPRSGVPDRIHTDFLEDPPGEDECPEPIQPSFAVFSGNTTVVDALAP